MTPDDLARIESLLAMWEVWSEAGDKEAEVHAQSLRVLLTAYQQVTQELADAREVLNSDLRTASNRVLTLELQVQRVTRERDEAVSLTGQLANALHMLGRPNGSPGAIDPTDTMDG